MLATMLYGAHDVRCEEVPEPRIEQPTDAIIRLSATCICGSDLWPYRGLNEVEAPMAMGHEYCGIVEEVGSAVATVRPGQFVVGSFCISDNTCPHCRYGFQSSCEQRQFMSGSQAPLARVPVADGTLVATAEVPPDALISDMLAVSDVLGTGWFAADAADAARVRPGGTVVVVGDGAVGQMGAGRIIAMSRHKARQDLALAFGATDIVSARGAEGVARVKEMTGGVGSGFGAGMRGLGGMDVPGAGLHAARRRDGLRRRAARRAVRWRSAVHRAEEHAGRPGPVRRFLPDLMGLVLDGSIRPGRVFDLHLPLADVAEGYRAMDERRAIKTLLRV